MAEISKPVDINKIWSASGDILAPSDTKISQGWAVEIPPRQYFNYIDNKQDQFNAHVNQHGIVVWDGSTEYQANKSYVQGTDGVVYRAKQTHTNQNPITDTSGVYWTPAFQGGLIAIRTFTSASSTYTPSPGTRFIVVKVQGDGGGGGGTAATPSGQAAAGGPGTGGAYAESLIRSGFSGISIVVGQGGAAVVGGNGGNGTGSSFGSLVVCPGGSGGGLGTPTTQFPSGTPLSVSNTATAGDFRIRGGIGTFGLVLSSGAAVNAIGGASYFAPQSSASFGSGGGGAISTQNNTARAGDPGIPGVVVIEEYM